MSTKQYQCADCGRAFKSPKDRDQHRRDKHQKLGARAAVGKAGAKGLLNQIGSGLPDGAYFAMADELGLDPEDL